ncbi:MAG: hypothetical protein ABJB76_01245 [Candidatus Nitrosocosmicus sp.]
MDIWIQTTSNICNNRGSYITIDSRDVTTANVQDNQMYVTLTTTTTSSSSAFSLPSALYMIADPAGYDVKNLYEYSKKTLGINLVCPL